MEQRQFSEPYALRLLLSARLSHPSSELNNLPQPTQLWFVAPTISDERFSINT